MATAASRCRRACLASGSSTTSPPRTAPAPSAGPSVGAIGEEVREQLEYVPASLIVLEHVRPKYACRACAAHVVIAPRLPEPIEKGLPGTGLLAHVVTSKLADHLPLYRQEGIFRRHGVELSRSTMCDWMAASAGLLEPIVKAMARRVLASKVIGTDDTPVTVQDHAGKGSKTGRLWAYLGDRDNPFIVYDYTPDRSRDGPERFLKDYRAGYLQSDAYAGYDGLHARGLVEVGCWAHARRKFHEARTSDPERSHAAIAWIGRLYGVEREARDGGWDDARLMAARAERSRPLLESFGAWLEGGVDEGSAQEPGGRGDRLRAVELDGALRDTSSRRICRSTTTRSRMRSGRSRWGGKIGCISGATAAAARRRRS